MRCGVRSLLLDPRVADPMWVCFNMVQGSWKVHPTCRMRQMQASVRGHASTKGRWVGLINSVSFILITMVFQKLTLNIPS